MENRETREDVRGKKGILSKIQNFFTLGYGTKEDLRELDRGLRDFYYSDLRDMRHVWEDIYLELLESEIQVSVRDLKQVLQVLDRVMEKVRHADYGYAGLWDRKGHIREEELARVYNYDKSLGELIEKLKGSVEKIYSDVEAENWTDVQTNVKKVKSLLFTFEDKWRERDKEFRRERD